MDTGLQDRVVMVTGASRGIGRAIAIAFGGEGARVAITYHHNETAAKETAAAVERVGGHALPVPLDLEDLPTIGAAADAVRQRWGTIEVLVANAVRWGGTAPDPSVRFEDVALTEWQAMLAANLIGAATTVRAVLPGMRAKGWGRIVLMSSGVAEEGVPGPGPYGTAKSGLHGMARALAWEGGRDGVLVDVVAPGFTLTERAVAFPEAVRSRLAAAVPSRRLSDPQDVAQLVVFLGSAANGNVSGEIVREGSANGRAPHPSP